MERIVIEVDNTTAKRWRKSGDGKRKKINAIIKKALKQNDKLIVKEPEPGYGLPTEKEMQKHSKKVIATRPGYKKFLNDIREKAAKNGLTEEVLNHLLDGEA
jgi:hypothetical protein